MRTLLVVVFLFLIAPLTSGQVNSSTDKNAAVKAELRKLLVDLNDARAKRDRAALERIYADEFLFIHASGVVGNKIQTISEVMSVTGNVTPLSLPSFEQLHVYGDVAVLRTQETGRQTTAIYARESGRWQTLSCRGRLCTQSAKHSRSCPLFYLLKSASMKMRLAIL